MNGIIRKLVVSALALLLSVVMMVTISYAWMTISDSPVAEGIQISIAGGNTILIAPDKIETVDGVTYHYPGFFKDSLEFGRYEEYAYLKELSGLTPVSTADGVHWFLPTYYDLFDDAVQNGTAVAGQVKPITEFLLDTSLEYANLRKQDLAKAKAGSYVYLDFWVVSPGSDYELRLSDGDGDTGSFALELKQPAVTEDGTYRLVTVDGAVAASLRVGFLTNPDLITDNTMKYYQESAYYDSDYTKLCGSYQEKGTGLWYSSEYRFCIYEPNGDLHRGDANGSYLVTSPVMWDGSAPCLGDVSENLAVQMTNKWALGVSHDLIDELFTTAVLGKKPDSSEEAKTIFYDDYLQGQIAPYVEKGAFLKYTSSLYASATDGTVSQETLATLAQAGATDDAAIARLEKNVPQRIRMFLWIEGQDADCTDTVCALELSLGVELAGSHRKWYGKTKKDDQ